MSTEEYKLKYPDAETTDPKLRIELSNRMKSLGDQSPLSKWMRDHPEEHKTNSVKNIQEYNSKPENRAHSARILQEYRDTHGNPGVKYFRDHPEEQRRIASLGGKAIAGKNLASWRSKNPELASECAKRACRIGFEKRMRENPDKVRLVALRNNRYRKYPYKSDKYQLDQVFCSSWEVKFVQLLERCTDVEVLEYEPFSIDYVIDNTHKKYYPDFLVTLTNGTKYIVEIKPNYLAHYDRVNLTKFKFANDYCSHHNYKFIIIDESLIKTNDEISTSAQQLLDQYGVDDIV